MAEGCAWSLRRFAVGTCVATLALLMGAGIALAQPEASAEADARARVHFEAGTAYFQEADYQSALREFQQAHELSGRPALLYNLSLVHERLGQHAAAADHLERYLAEEDPGAIDDRAGLERKASNLRALAARTQPNEPPPPPEPARRRVSTPAIASYAVAGVGAVAFAVLGGLALAEDAKLEDDCETRACGAGDVDRLESLTLAADVGLGVALVGAVLGTILLFTSGEEPEEEQVRLVPGVSTTYSGTSIELRF